MSPQELEQRLARSLEDYMVRRTNGDRPRPEEYEADLADAYDEFLSLLDVEDMLDDLLEPSEEQALPREFGPYTLIRELGRGGAGIVYEGVHRKLGRRDAVKVLRTGFDGESAALARFAGEARALADVRHDNIVRIYDADLVDGHPYYAMELLEGRSLQQVALAADRPSPQEICRGLAGVADALATLQAKGTVHRDVKPSNIIVRDDGHMVLADFGLARSLEQERITRTGQALGTPLYMSPEQFLARRDEIDGRTDVYGLGATLYEALAGQPVFQADDLRALLRMVVSERPEPLRKVAPHVDADCAAIAMKALEKRRRDRYDSAADMRADLLAYADGRTVRGRPISEVRHGLRRLKPFAWPIAAAFAVGLGLALWFLSRPATLFVATLDQVQLQIQIDGTDHGGSPLTAEVSPGSHFVTGSWDGVRLAEEWVDTSAGEHLPVHLTIAEATTPTELAAIRDSIGLGRASAPARHRGAADASMITYVFPRGRLLRVDAARWYLSLDADYEEGPAEIVFRRGSTVLHRESFEPDLLDTEGTLPADVVASLVPGDRISWGVEVGERALGRQIFEIAHEEGTIREDLAQLDEALEAQTEPVRAYFRAAALLDHEMPVSAFRVAQAATNPDDPAASGLAPWMGVRDALRALGAEGSKLYRKAFLEPVSKGFDAADLEAWDRR